MLLGTDADETIDGAGSSDIVDGSGGNDSIKGGDASVRDQWTGNHDILIGGSGDDTIDRAAGNDTLTGGADDGTFVFQAAMEPTRSRTSRTGKTSST